MRWLVLGSRGMFGADMFHYLKSKNLDVTGLTSSDLDLTSKSGEINQRIRDFDVVVNAAAYTDVNRAEKDRSLALELNYRVPEKLARICASNGQQLVHISSDYVFDGLKGTPYTPTDDPKPINFYGLSKLMGERAVAENDAKALILRASWLYGPKGRCFPRSIIEKARLNERISVIDTQIGTPTSTWFLREFCLRAVIQQYSGGIYHAVPTGQTTWFGFATELTTGLGAKVVPTTNIGTSAARRPVNSTLAPHDLATQSWEECWREIKDMFL